MKRRRVDLTTPIHPPDPTKLPIYGNYTSYYTKRHATDRLAFLPREYFYGKRVLDVGCNAGHLTIDIARRYAPRRIVGVDIDVSLVQKAHSQVQFVYSLQGDTPRCFPSMLGHIPFPHERTCSFPFNVEFCAQDYMIRSKRDMVQDEEYDTILCLSVTKWIHLHYGDQGMVKLFARLYSQLSVGGVLILEPQEFKGYAKKSKWSPHMRQTFEEIQFKPIAFDAHLQSIGFTRVQQIDEADGFARTMFVYRK